MRIFHRLAGVILKFITPKETESIREEQMLLHPGIPGAKLTREYYENKFAILLAVLTIGFITSVLILIKDIRQSGSIEYSRIERRSYGEGEMTVPVDLYSDGKLFQKDKIITVAEKHYTEQEADRVFKEVETELGSSILGENQSADHIDRDLTLPDSSEHYPVSIEWSVGDYDVLDNDGHIQRDFHDETGRTVELTASLSYENYHEDFSFFVKVYPLLLAPEDRLSYEIDRTINRYASETISADAQVLPDTVEGHSLTYKRSLPHTWIYVLIMTVFAAFLVYTGKDHDLKKEVGKREREMLLDYPEVVSKLTLLIGAGLTLRSAFEKVAMDYKNRTYGRQSFACEEMLITVYRMRSGVSEYEAYLDFGKRCAVKRYTKLGALFSQNIKKGSLGLLPELEKEVHDAFEERKANARKRGEEAGTMLLLPMALMLSVVMIIVIVPAFLSFTMTF